MPGIGPMICAGTHLCHQFEENKIAQANKILEILGTVNQPVLMVGDFNFRPDTEPYQIITGSFGDAALVKGNPHYTIPSKKPSAPISSIFFSPRRQKLLPVTVVRDGASARMRVLEKLQLERKSEK